MSNNLDFSNGMNESKGVIQQIKNSLIQSGVNTALHNSGVMRHGLNAAYYANHNRPGLAIREGSVAVFDAITGSRR